MKVLLLQPPNAAPIMDQVFLFEPLALEYLGAGARLDGHEVMIHDSRLDPDLEGALLRFKPDVVGITSLTSQVNITLGTARRVRELFPETLVIVGGHHASVRPEEFFVPAVDLVVIGEGVFALREILAAKQAGAPFDGIAGIAFPAREGWKLTPARPYTDLNDLPLPDRSLTEPYRRSYFSEWFKPLASLRTSLGCTARCTFCALWGITRGKYLRRDPEAVLEELKGIAEPNIFFCDDESMCDTNRMSLLADRIRSANIKKRYFLYARVDTIVKHPELFRKWADIGLVQVFVGMEDFSEERLRAMKKGVTPDQQERAVKILQDLGIMMYASFMVSPEFSKEDFRGMRNYIRKLKLKYATFTVMTPLPGTELYSAREKELTTRKPELFDMLHALFPTRLPLDEFYQELADLYLQAVPWYRSLPLLMKFGLHGMFLRLRLGGTLLDKIRRSSRDHEGRGVQGA